MGIHKIITKEKKERAIIFTSENGDIINKKLADLFKMYCTNSHRTQTLDGKRQRYKRQDLDAWSKEFYDQCKLAFYTKPVNPAEPNGELVLAEPEYEYRLIRPLSEKEFKNIFGETFRNKPIY